MRVICILLLVRTLFSFPGLPPIQHPSLVDEFYRRRHQSLFWFRSGDTAASLRVELLSRIDSGAWCGLDSNAYHPALLRAIPFPGSPLPSSRSTSQTPGTSAQSPANLSLPVLPAYDAHILMEWDRLYTDAALALSKDLLQGADIDRMISYDGVSPIYAPDDDRYLLDGLGRANAPTLLRAWFEGLEPKTGEYPFLKTALAGSFSQADNTAGRTLGTAMNAWRWIHHRSLSRYVVVNIPAATLKYFERDSMILSMKVVVGQTSKRTPRFAAWCNRIILHPYWNVPRKIVINELLPLFKKEPAIVPFMNMQLLDGRGRIVDPATLPWHDFTRSNFPYSVRQATGCDNALGVIKFDINNPFDVYMHDTNLKSAFKSSYRYYSHGCIRLEKPFALGLELLHDKLDTVLLRACVRDQKPFTISLEKPVPVFVTYVRVEADTAGRISYYKDVYHLDP